MKKNRRMGMILLNVRVSASSLQRGCAMPKILIVDDSALARRTMRRILESAGNEVIEAEDGITGIESYFLEKPDLVVLDLTMPDMNGLKVLEQLREMDAQARILVATADIQTSSKIMAEEAGARGFITKPYDPDIVLGMVRSVLAV